jgi:Mrp family chromosome partitioning ATPase
MPTREIDQALTRLFESQRSKEPHTSEVSRPHFQVPRHAEVTEAAGTKGTPLWSWPDVVLELESKHPERFSTLAERVVEAGQQGGVKVFLVTSAHRAEGRTTLALSLAKALGSRQGTTLLVDADLQAPMLARRLGFPVAVGLDDVVLHTRNWSDALVTFENGLALLPLRTPIERPREFLNSPAWSCLLARLRREYDRILLDGNPLFHGLSASLFHRSVDSAILVYRRGQTADRALRNAREVLEAGGIPLLGLAENFA